MLNWKRPKNATVLTPPHHCWMRTLLRYIKRILGGSDKILHRTIRYAEVYSQYSIISWDFTKQMMKRRYFGHHLSLALFHLTSLPPLILQDSILLRHFEWWFTVCTTLLNKKKLIRRCCDEREHRDKRVVSVDFTEKANDIGDRHSTRLNPGC